MSKAGHEAFRVAKFAGGCIQHACEGSGSLEAEEQEEEEEEHNPGEPDRTRVILHFDADCFYAQVEELRDPSLRTRPLGITQKYLVVTCNYPARAAGVTKLMNIEEAKKKCPHIVLIPGEDLTPYRRTSARVFNVLSHFGSAVQKLGMDEIAVDVTDSARDLVRKSQGAGRIGLRWCGHVHRSQQGVHSSAPFRPMDLRVTLINSSVELMTTGAEGGGSDSTPFLLHPNADGKEHAAALSDSDLLLMAGSMKAAEARAAVREQTGVRMSAGIAHNKLLAKLASGLHKPDDQTALPASESSFFLRPLPVQVLRGAGYQTCRKLQAANVHTVGQLRAVPKQRLMALLGERTGACLHALAHGRDSSAVAQTSAPKSITVEDSFKRCTTWEALALILRVLAPDLMTRLQEDAAEHMRVPRTLTVTWRHAARDGGSGYFGRKSASTRFPCGSLGGQGKQSASGAMETFDGRVAAVARECEGVLRKHLREPFHLTLLNIGVSGFIASVVGRGGGGQGVALGATASAAVDAFDVHASRALESVGERPARLLSTTREGRVGGRSAAAGGGQRQIACEVDMTQGRADYDCKLKKVGLGAGVLSKRRERALRECQSCGGPATQGLVGSEEVACVTEPQQQDFRERFHVEYVDQWSDAAESSSDAGDACDAAGQDEASRGGCGGTPAEGPDSQPVQNGLLPTAYRPRWGGVEQGVGLEQAEGEKTRLRDGFAGGMQDKGQGMPCDKTAGNSAVFSQGLVSLAEMGFVDRDEGLAALRAAKGSVSAAVGHLIASQTGHKLHSAPATAAAAVPPLLPRGSAPADTRGEQAGRMRVVEVTVANGGLGPGAAAAAATGAKSERAPALRRVRQGVDMRAASNGKKQKLIASFLTPS